MSKEKKNPPKKKRKREDELVAKKDQFLACVNGLLLFSSLLFSSFPLLLIQFLAEAANIMGTRNTKKKNLGKTFCNHGIAWLFKL